MNTAMALVCMGSMHSSVDSWGKYMSFLYQSVLILYIAILSERNLPRLTVLDRSYGLALLLSVKFVLFASWS